MYREPLFAKEAALVANAGAKRREEFTAGRNAARAALAMMGLAPCPILRTPQRGPLWPRGFIGSITHCNGFCCAVVARSSDICSLGIDVEENDPLEKSLAEIVCTRSELISFTTLPELPSTNWEKIAFCAKESFYKYFNPLTNSFLDFRDVSVQFSLEPAGNAGAFGITIAKSGEPLHEASISGAWRLDAHRVYAGVSPPAGRLNEIS
jgi:4'-phosphopantetheinyl transferase EntD